MSDPQNRRKFVGTVALGAATAGLGVAAPLVGDEPTKDKEKAQPPKPPTEADARMGLVIARFGKHLDDSARKSIRGEVDAIVHRAASLRKFKLDNGDGPFPVFTPYRAPIALEDDARNANDR